MTKDERIAADKQQRIAKFDEVQSAKNEELAYKLRLTVHISR